MDPDRFSSDDVAALNQIGYELLKSGDLPGAVRAFSRSSMLEPSLVSSTNAIYARVSLTNAVLESAEAQTE